MRILWAGVAPWCGSGYGVVTANMVPRLKELGHQIAILACYGHKGRLLDWHGIPIFGNESDDWGNTFIPLFYKEFEADVLITLFDIWVCRNFKEIGLTWCPYFPVDHQPVPPMVTQRFPAAHRLIAMSHFGQQEVERAGYQALYVPHGVDTKVFLPRPEREEARKELGVEGKFVIGSVATNIGDRKNFDLMLQVFAEFHQHHPDSVFYCYTNPKDKNGSALAEEAQALNLNTSVLFPIEEVLVSGLPPEAMAVLYSCFDAFISLSKGEGFGLPIIEAQSCGVPVVVTDYTSMTELKGPGMAIPVASREWSKHRSWWGIADKNRAVQALDILYKEFRKGNKSRGEKAREFALNYDWDLITGKYWKPALADIENSLPSRKLVQVPFPTQDEDTLS